MKKIISILGLNGILLLLMGANTFVDPTQPPSYNANPQSATTSGPLQLSAIFIYPTYRLAIINSQAVKVGDRIGEFTITAITPYTVELVSGQNNKQVLQLTLSVKRER